MSEVNTGYPVPTEPGFYWRFRPAPKKLVGSERWYVSQVALEAGDLAYTDLIPGTLLVRDDGLWGPRIEPPTDESTELFDDLMTGMNEAVAYARGEETGARVTVHEVRGVSKEEQVEKLAAHMHKVWSVWVEYMLRKLGPLVGNELLPRDMLFKAVRLAAQTQPLVTPQVASVEAWERWERQMATDYADLSESEKESDRDIARKIIELLDGPK